MNRLQTSALALIALPLSLSLAQPLQSSPSEGSAGNLPPVCILEFTSTGMGGSANIPITPPVTTVGLSACNSFDPEGGPLTFQWLGCPGVHFSNPTSCNTTVSIATPPGSNFSCEVRCLITDNAGNTFSGSCRLRMDFYDNTPPTCVLATSLIQVLAQSSSVTVSLDACASFDPDLFQTLSFDWDGCPNATFSNEFGCATDMTIDLTGVSLPTSCTATVNISDGVAPPTVCTVQVLIDAGPDLDFCPLSCPTKVNVLNPAGSLRTVVIGSTGFDVTQIVQSTLMARRADGVGTPFPLGPYFVTDMGTPDLDPACDCLPQVPDGIPDLVTIISLPQMVNNLQLINEPLGSFVEVEVTGMLVTGASFTVSDCFLIQ